VRQGVDLVISRDRRRHDRPVARVGADELGDLLRGVTGGVRLHVAVAEEAVLQQSLNLAHAHEPRVCAPRAVGVVVLLGEAQVAGRGSAVLVDELLGRHLSRALVDLQAEDRAALRVRGILELAAASHTVYRCSQWADPGVKPAIKSSDRPVRPRPRACVATGRSGCSHRSTGRLYPCKMCDSERVRMYSD
jgi:hypothetical protein